MATVPARYTVHEGSERAIALFLETVEAMRASTYATTTIAALLRGEKGFGFTLRLGQGQASAEVRVGDQDHLRSLLLDLRKLVLNDQPQNLYRVFKIVKRAETDGGGDANRLAVVTTLHDRYKARMREPSGVVDPTRATKPASTSPEDMLEWVRTAPMNTTHEEFLMARLHGDLFHDDADLRARIPEGDPWSDGARHGLLAKIVLDVYFAADNLARLILHPVAQP